MENGLSIVEVCLQSDCIVTVAAPTYKKQGTWFLVSDFIGALIAA
jgi:hypothetical protein